MLPWRTFVPASPRYRTSRSAEGRSTCVRCYGRTVLLLAPSNHPEAFGRVVVEAQASGIPSVARDVGGLGEAVGAGGVLMPPSASAAEWAEGLSRQCFRIKQTRPELRPRQRRTPRVRSSSVEGQRRTGTFIALAESHARAWLHASAAMRRDADHRLAAPSWRVCLFRVGPVVAWLDVETVRAQRPERGPFTTCMTGLSCSSTMTLSWGRDCCGPTRPRRAASRRGSSSAAPFTRSTRSSRSHGSCRIYPPPRGGGVP